MSTQTHGEPVSVGKMKLRDLGNSYGFTVSKDALDELGLLDEDGDLVDEEIEARQNAYDCGRVLYRIPIAEIDCTGD